MQKYTFQIPFPHFFLTSLHTLKSQMKKSLLVWIILLALGCKENRAPVKSAFLGGQIIKPSSEYVSLYKYDQRFDSLPLDAESRFSKKYDSLPYGLFKMEHLPENQMVIIEAGDSIWARANMTEFNASLVFSGKGSAKNNFLINTYLGLQKEVGFLASKYAQDSEAFSGILDSLLEEKKIAWSKFEQQNTLSPLAQKITQAAFVYPYANRRERYALIRGKKAIENDSTYFNFRKFLNYGERDLVFFEPYINYMMSYLSQEALDEDGNYMREKERTDFNIRRIQIIDDRISNPVLRNTLARTVAYEELLNFKNHQNHERFLQFYLQVNTSPLYMAEIFQLHQSLIQMRPGKPLSQVQLETYEGDQITSTQAFQGTPTVLYFWSQSQMNHFKRTQERVRRYREEYPSYRFVGICIQPYNDLVRNYQSIMGIDPTDQLAVVNFEEVSEKWVITLLNKGIIIDKNGQILEGFGNFFDQNFTNLLQKFTP